MLAEPRSTAALYVVFSQPMNIATFTNSNNNFATDQQSGSGLDYHTNRINADATGRVLTITPISLLAVNSQYYLSLSSGITDATARA